jgi:hypothetical protein
MDLQFALGAFLSLGIVWFCAWMRARVEWAARRDLERRLSKLERNLCCGAGFVGCTGGPRCTSDHK